jgi:pimeloyl-ACP methyl ester carboxylesterase
MGVIAVTRTKLNGVELDIRQRGSGPPVLFVHGGMGDECAAVVEERALTDHYRVIDYHRRGWGDSSAAEGAVSIAQQAADCRAVIEHLDVAPVHAVGQSFGGIVVLQLALDAPTAVHSFTVIEPPLPSVVFNSPTFGAVAEQLGALFGSGDKEGAVDAFAREVGGDDFHAEFDRTMPVGYMQRWVDAADTVFQSEIPSLQDWRFSEEEAARITQPVLNIVGADTRPYFRDSHDALQAWLLHAESLELPDATHCVFQTNPAGAAQCLATFLSRHPIPGY